MVNSDSPLEVWRTLDSHCVLAVDSTLMNECAANVKWERCGIKSTQPTSNTVSFHLSLKLHSVLSGQIHLYVGASKCEVRLEEEGMKDDNGQGSEEKQALFWSCITVRVKIEVCASALHIHE